jgi:hypothetical protein
MRTKNIKALSFSLLTVLGGALALTGCATTPEERAAFRAESRAKMVGMPIRTYVVYAYRGLTDGRLVPLNPKVKNFTHEETYWRRGFNFKEVTPFDQDSREKDYCEANGGRLEYLGKVKNVVPVRTLVQSRSDFARDNPYAVITDASRDIYVSNRRLDLSQTTVHFAKDVNSVNSHIDAKKYGKFQCVTTDKKVLFKVSYAPLTISEGDKRPGEIATQIGATIQTERRFEFN